MDIRQTSLEKSAWPSGPDESAQEMKNGLTSLEWAELIKRVEADDEVGLSRLYDLFSQRIRDQLQTQLGPQELEYKVDDTLLSAVNAIKRGHLRRPEHMTDFVNTVVRRHLATYIETPALQDQLHQSDGEEITGREHSPEQQEITRERAKLMKRALDALPQRDREILTRSYLQEQDQKQICRDLSLTETQFRLLRSRAKAKLGEISRRMLAEQARKPADFLEPLGQSPIQQRRDNVRTSSRFSKAPQKHSSSAFAQDTNIEIFMAAAIAFQGVDEGKLWLTTPSESFNGKPPLSVINSVEGRQKILNELALVEHGMF